MDAASQGLAIVREILDGVLIESCHPSSFKEMGEVSEEENTIGHLDEQNSPEGKRRNYTSEDDENTSLEKLRDRYLLMPSDSNLVRQIKYLLKLPSLAPYERIKVKNLDQLIKKSAVLGFNVGLRKKEAKPCSKGKNKSKKLPRIQSSPRNLRSRKRSSQNVCKIAKVCLVKVKLSPATRKRCEFFSPVKAVKRAKVFMSTISGSPTLDWSLDELNKSPLTDTSVPSSSTLYKSRKNLFPQESSSGEMATEGSNSKGSLEVPAARVQLGSTVDTGSALVSLFSDYC